jgi:predicted oxidoreductase
MKTINLGKTSLKVPQIAVGCMRIGGLDAANAELFVKTALELGANFFDHADVYGGGACESVFSKAIGMNASVREKIFIQSKCGIVPGKMFDFSKNHILESVDGILSRLGTDYLDVLLLHRPDALMEPEEVAEAFDGLESSGKVRNFGVSNQDPYTIELLKTCVRQPIACNQLQLSIANATMISQPMNLNMLDGPAVDRDNGVRAYCRINGITVQPWSPFQHGMFEGPFIGNPKFKELNLKLEELASKYGATPTALALAWIVRLPDKMQPVTGTMNPDRLRECVKGIEVELSREDWYSIYLAAGYRLP